MVSNVIKKIQHIFVGWFNRIFKRNRYLYNKRIQICNTCKYKERFLTEEYCSLCGCPLKSKLVVTDEVCYDKRW